jgi:LysM repeat protein
MTLEVQNLAELDDDDVEQAYALAAQLVQEKFPNVDMKRGVVSDLVTGLDAILGAAQAENTDRMRQSQSIVLIEANPTIADDDLVDNVASNYRVTRQAATYATGEVVIVLDQQQAVSVQAGQTLTAGSSTYTSDATYSARLTAAQVTSPTDRLLVEIETGRWAFAIDVTAAVAGSAALLSKDDELTPTLPVSSFVQAYAAADFIGGLDAQTNAELIALLESGMSTKAYANRPMIKNMIRNADTAAYTQVTSAFADILAMSIIGYGDVEMIRDQHWLFPVSGGGRSDIYLRSQRKPATIALTKTATLVDVTVNGGIWQASITRDNAPGFYEVTNIRIAGSAADGTNYAVTADTRGMDITDTGSDYIPDLETALEAVYSRFQTAVVQFLDTDTATAGLVVGVATQSYDITVAYDPLVKQVQEFIGLRDVRNPLGDHVVKGAIPCFTTLSVTLERKDTSATVDEDDVTDALVDYVNTTGFPGKLYTSELASAINALLPTGVSTGTITMLGRIRNPDGTDTIITSSDTLTIVNDNPNFVSSRTVIFILDEDDVSITINNVAVAEA